MEVLGEVAARRRPEGGRGGPRVGVGVTRLDVLRNLGAGEVPDLDAIAVPQMRKHTTGHLVESVAEATGVGVRERTTCVGLLSSDAIRAKDVGGKGRNAIRLRRVLVEGTALATSVQRILVGQLEG